MKLQICFMKTRCNSVLNLNVNVTEKMDDFFLQCHKRPINKVVSLLPQLTEQRERDPLETLICQEEFTYGIYILKKRHILLCRKSYFSAENNSWSLCSCLETCLVLIIFNGDEYLYLRKYFGLQRKKEGAFGFECLYNSNVSWYSEIYCDS